MRVAHHDRPGAPRVPPAGRAGGDREATSRSCSSAQEDEDSFDEGLAVGIQALLVSPDFLFRIERDRRGARAGSTSHPITPARAGVAAVVLPLGEHAGRRSCGARRTPARCATRRSSPRRCGGCCATRRSHALAENFGGQWLQFRALESLTRDRERFPDFEDYLRLSMRRETELFVEHVIREDRSILDFLDGKYSFLNERLARHYGIAGVLGPGIPARGSDRHAARRRAHAGQRADGVVVRDAHLAGAARQVDPRQPAQRAAARPPADVPNLDEAAIGTARVDAPAARGAPQGSDLRRRAIAGWTRSASASRTSTRSAPGGRPTASSRSTRRACCPTATSSTDRTSCATILERQHDAFARCLTAKLLTYALGRGLERYDTRTVKRHRGATAGAANTGSRRSSSRSSTACRSSRGGPPATSAAVQERR